jgi:hypothetical protein
MSAAVKAIGICLFIVSAAVGYVRQSHEISVLKIRSARLEREWQQLRVHNAEQRRVLLHRHTHASIEQEVARHRSGLGPARPGQVIVLPLSRLESGEVRAADLPRLAAREGIR